VLLRQEGARAASALGFMGVQEIVVAGRSVEYGLGHARECICPSVLRTDGGSNSQRSVGMLGILLACARVYVRLLVMTLLMSTSLPLHLIFFDPIVR